MSIQLKILDKIINYGLYLFVFLLPWQTRWIFQEASVNDQVWEYGRLSLYASEIILLIVLILALVRYLKSGSRQFWLSLILFLIWSGLSIIWSLNQSSALYIWIKVIEALALFWLVKSRKVNLSFSLLITGFIQAVYGFYQFLSQGMFAANKWLGLAAIDAREPGTSVIEFLDQRWLRAYGSLPHPNIFGGLMAVCLLVAIIGLWQLNREVKGLKIIPKKSYFLNYFYWLTVIMTFFGLIVSFSRSAWLAFVASFVYLIVISFKDKFKVERVINLKIAGVLMIIFAFFFLIFPHQLLTTRLKGQSRLEQVSLEERADYLDQAKELIQSNWLLGQGLGNYTQALINKDSSLPGFDYQPVHNLYLLILSELGIVGFVLFICLLWQVFRKSDKAYFSLMLCLLIIALFDHYLWTLYFSLMIFWLILGLTQRSDRDSLN